MEQLQEAITDLTIKTLNITESRDILRKAEGNNILQIIYECRFGLETGEMDFREIDETLHQIAQRVDFLLDNPQHAGLHEKHRK